MIRWFIHSFALLLIQIRLFISQSRSNRRCGKEFPSLEWVTVLAHKQIFYAPHYIFPESSVPYRYYNRLLAANFGVFICDHYYFVILFLLIIVETETRCDNNKHHDYVSLYGCYTTNKRCQQQLATYHIKQEMFGWRKKQEHNRNDEVWNDNIGGMGVAGSTVVHGIRRIPIRSPAISLLGWWRRQQWWYWWEQQF